MDTKIQTSKVGNLIKVEKLKFCVLSIDALIEAKKAMRVAFFEDRTFSDTETSKLKRSCRKLYEHYWNKMGKYHSFDKVSQHDTNQEKLLKKKRLL